MSLPPNLDLSRFVNNVKTTSSRLVRREFSDQLGFGRRKQFAAYLCCTMIIRFQRFLRVNDRAHG